MKSLALISGLVCLPVLAGLHAQDNWKLSKEVDGVQIYHRAQENQAVKALKIKTHMEGSASAAIAFLSDVNNACSWVEHCLQSFLIDKKSPTDYTFYQLIDFPWPYADREYVLHARISQDPGTQTVHLRSTAKPDAYPLTKGHFRVQTSDSHWKIMPDKPGFIRIEYTLQTDPGDALPAWIVNLALEKGPLRTIRHMRQALRTEPYASQKLDFIKEPSTR